MNLILIITAIGMHIIKVIRDSVYLTQILIQIMVKIGTSTLIQEIDTIQMNM